MNFNQLTTIEWAAQRVTYLDSINRYEDSCAVSQEFIEWTTCLNIFPKGIETSTQKVPDFN